MHCCLPSIYPFSRQTGNGDHDDDDDDDDDDDEDQENDSQNPTPSTSRPTTPSTLKSQATNQVNIFIYTKLPQFYRCMSLLFHIFVGRLTLRIQLVPRLTTFSCHGILPLSVNR